MSKGFVNVSFAKSVVVIETGQLTDYQFAQVKRVLGETFGSMMVKELPHHRLEVSWFAYREAKPRKLFSRDKKPAMTPERLRDICMEQMERHAASIGLDVDKPARY